MVVELCGLLSGWTCCEEVCSVREHVLVVYVSVVGLGVSDLPGDMSNWCWWGQMGRAFVRGL
jgi:hypothetical protein